MSHVTMPGVYPPAVLARVRRAERWRPTAWHEAGHAVAAVRLGEPVTAVALTPGRPDRLAGVCWVTRPPGLQLPLPAGVTVTPRAQLACHT